MSRSRPGGRRVAASGFLPALFGARPGEDMNQHSLRVLEFDKVRDALVDRTTWAGGLRRCRAIAPGTAAYAIARRLAQVSEVRRVLDEADLPIAGLPDLAETIAEAEPDGSILSGARIAPVARSLRIVQALLAFLHEWRERTPLLWDIGRGMASLAELRERIDGCMDAEGVIRDDATPGLRKIRRDQERARERVLAALRRLAQSLASDGAEALVTLRNDRYVISVRRDRVQGLHGVVHGQSGSGASVYLEPSSAVEGNNELAELRSAEDEEILRILAEVTAAVRARLVELRTNQDILAELDSLRAAGLLSRDLAAEPARPSDGDDVDLRRARHPLLTMRLRGTETPVVPLDLVLGGEHARILVITGPNTGGKTVALKTLGLLVLMNQSGLHVPAAEGTRLPIFRDVFADIGDEQSIEASLSTFSSHMAHVIEGLKRADEHTLVLLDEVGVGTDPEEGSALGRAVLAELARKASAAIVTTHYGALKAFAHEHPAMENASLEFDRDSLSPTYRFLQGVPGSSEGLAIARRLGFPEHLVEEARGWLGEDKAALDGLLQDLAERRKNLEQEHEVLERERAEVRDTADRVAKRLQGVAEERARAKREALEEARALVERAKAELGELLGAVRDDGAEGRAAGRARTRLGEMGRGLERRIAETERDVRAEPRHPARPEDVRDGTPVLVTSMGWKGTALGPPGPNGKVAVNVGSLRMEVPVSALELRPAETRRPRHAVTERPEGSTALELDLRGRTVEEALIEVDRTLDGLVVSGGTWLRIIHGKGTGALRHAITEQLKTDGRVKEFRMGEPNEGGTGVTIAVLG